MPKKSLRERHRKLSKALAKLKERKSLMEDNLTTLEMIEIRAIGVAMFGERWLAPLAKTLGIAPQSLWRYKTGERKIPEELLESAREAVDTKTRLALAEGALE